MPQLSTIVLTDRATPTPINRTFTPHDIVNGVATVIESTGVPIGDNRFTVSLTKSTVGKQKARLQLTMPTVETSVVNGVNIPVVTRTAIADLTFKFDNTSTEQERKNLVGMLKSSLDSSQTLVNDTVIKLQGVY